MSRHSKAKIFYLRKSYSRILVGRKPTSKNLKFKYRKCSRAVQRLRGSQDLSHRDKIRKSNSFNDSFAALLFARDTLKVKNLPTYFRLIICRIAT